MKYMSSMLAMSSRKRPMVQALLLQMPQRLADYNHQRAWRWKDLLQCLQSVRAPQPRHPVSTIYYNTQDTCWASLIILCQTILQYHTHSFNIVVCKRFRTLYQAKRFTKVSLTLDFFVIMCVYGRMPITYSVMNIHGIADSHSKSTKLKARTTLKKKMYF